MMANLLNVTAREFVSRQNENGGGCLFNDLFPVQQIHPITLTVREEENIRSVVGKEQWTKKGHTTQTQGRGSPSQVDC